MSAGELVNRLRPAPVTSTETAVSASIPACAGCGQCCHLLVELAPGVDSVPEEMVVEHDGIRCLEQRGNGACIALDQKTRLCLIYERRPQVCRQFERGSGLCLSVLEGRRSRAILDGVPRPR